MLSKFLLDAKKLNIPRQNSMSREGLKKTFKDTIINIKRYFFLYSSISIQCLDELLKQQVIDKIVYDQKLMDDAIRKVTYTCYIEKF